MNKSELPLKCFEIRDRATVISAFGIKMISQEPKRRFLLRHANFTRQDLIYLTIIADRRGAKYPEEWEKYESRTLVTAHRYIQQHFDELEDCAVIDVEYILGEAEKPAISVLEEILKEDKSWLI